MIPSCDPTDTEGCWELLEDLTKNAKQVQEQVLETILSQNANTEYLKGFLDGGQFSAEDSKQLFKERVPVVNYEDIRPYIERIAAGETSHIISSQPIIELLTSSGTAGGQPKMMPSTAEELDRKTFFFNMLIPVINKHVDGLDRGKAMSLLFVKPEISTPAGLMARPVLTSYYKSKNFKNRPFNKYNVYTSPDEIILCTDSRQSMYCQLLCGLVHRLEVLRVGAVFASAFLRAIKFLEDHWRELCSNIRTGSLSEWITDPSCRKAASLILGQANPELADLIQNEFGGGRSRKGIIKRIWPNTKYVEVIVTGSMAQYIPTLEYYSGGLHLVSTMYGSSECFLGFNLNPLCDPCDVCYTLLPNMAYFEFLRVDKNSHDSESVSLDSNNNTDSNNVVHSNGNVKDKKLQNEVVALVDVERGQYYELIVTTFTGLYRYRVGDILKVTGFHNDAPQFRFVERRNVVLSIDTDKTNEEDLLKAISKANLLIEPLGFLLTEYTSYADTSAMPGHYVLFWELKMKEENNNYQLKLDGEIMEECCAVVEESLDSVYRRCRKKDKSIGPLEIRVVRHGTFDALMDLSVSKGSSVNQYKTPRCIKSEDSLEILDSRVVGRFFSKRVPFWEPGL